MKKILPLLLLTPTIANAECTPAPDCASIGYTQTSCETISLKCPFDTSKLFCLPCDSSFQYTCDASNEYGDGTSCNNKYQACCKTDCVVGAIYYSDKTCSSCVNNSKTPVGVVIKDNELIMSLDNPNPRWSNDFVDIEALPHSYSQDFAISDLDGKSNTSIIVAHYGENTDESTNATLRCYNYAPQGLESSKGSWYLPAYGELHTYLNPNYSKIKASIYKAGGYINTHYFWSSTETSQNEVWVLIAESGIFHHAKHNTSSAGCFLSLK